MTEMDEVKARGFRGHVIVMGYSFLGKYVTARLRELGLSYVVIARDETQAVAARANGDIAISSPVTHYFDTLKRGGIEHARAVVVSFEDDRDNMLAVMAAKKMNPSAKVVTVVNEKDLIDGVKAAQADVVIAPSDVMGRVLAISTVSDEVAGVFTSERMKGREIAEFDIRSDQISMADLERICPVLLTIRDGKIMSGVGHDFALRKGDVVYVLTDHESLVVFRDFINGKTDKSS